MQVLYNCANHSVKPSLATGNFSFKCAAIGASDVVPATQPDRSSTYEISESRENSGIITPYGTLGSASGFQMFPFLPFSCLRGLTPSGLPVFSKAPTVSIPDYPGSSSERAFRSFRIFRYTVSGFSGIRASGLSTKTGPCVFPPKRGLA